MPDNSKHYVAILPAADIELWALGGPEDGYETIQVAAWALTGDGIGEPLVLTEASGKLELITSWSKDPDKVEFVRGYVAAIGRQRERETGRSW